MTSKLVVNNIGPDAGISTVTVNGNISATKFIGPVEATTGSFTNDVTISGNLGVAGTITYEDVARVDATGISTFREGFKLGPLAGIALTAYKDGSIRTSGIITAASFVGSGANLTGLNVDSTALKDSGGNVKVQANTSGATLTGIMTAVAGNSTEGAFISPTAVGIGTTTTTGRNAGVSTASGTFQFDETSQRLTVYNGKLGQWLNVQTDPITTKYNTNSLDVNRKEFLVMEIIKSMNADNNLLFCYDANSTYAWHGGDSEVVDQSINGIYGATSNVSWTEKSGDATGYYQFNANSGNTYINLATRPGNELADTNSQYACCFWIYDADWSVLNENQWWVLNDGDWSPTGQVGIRMVERGTDGELRVRAAIGTGGDNNNDKYTTGWPNSGWIFVGVLRSINQMDQNKYEMYQSYRGLPANTDIELMHNLSNMAGGSHDRWGDMMIGARPDDYANTKNKHGSRISSIAFWSRHDGHMIDGTAGANTTQIPNWFNTIFKKTRFMFQ